MAGLQIAMAVTTARVSCVLMSETPILDLEREPPGPAHRRLALVLQISAGLLLAAILILGDEHRLPNWHWPAFNGLLLVPALYAVIAIHELGHLIAGKLAGLDIGGMAVGGFVILKSGRHWTFHFDRQLWTSGFFKPLATPRGCRPARFAWLIAGGPAASLLLTLACLLLWVRWGDGALRWIGSLFWLALWSAVFSLIPFTSGPSQSDGAGLWLLLRRPARARCRMALFAMMTEEAKGQRPREWDADLFQQALSIDCAAPEYSCCQLLAYYRRLDEGAQASALRHLEDALAGCGKSGRRWRHAVFLEAGAASALLRNRPAQARTWYQRACKLRKPMFTQSMHASLTMAEGRYEEALRHWEAARREYLRKRLDSGLARFALEKWAEYAERCRAACERSEPCAINLS